MCVLLFINQADDAQPSDSPDEQPMTGFGMQRPLAIAPIVPGQTVHAHASDKPKRPSYPTSDVSPADMALKVQLKAHREHQIKLKVRYNGTAFNFLRVAYATVVKSVKCRLFPWPSCSKLG